MTWEEAERMMALIREQQARNNATMARLNQKLNRLTGKIDYTAKKVDCTTERAITLLATAKHARKIRKFDERLKALLNVVERYTR